MFDTIIHKKTGLLIRSKRGFINSIVKLFKDDYYNNYLGYNAREFIIANFDWMQIVKKWSKLFEEINNNVPAMYVAIKGHLCRDHIHMLISIPPKYSVSQVIGYIKGKSAIYIARNFTGYKMNFGGQKFWARGYHVSTSGRDEQIIRNYIKDQEKEDRKEDDMQQDNLFNQ